MIKTIIKCLKENNNVSKWKIFEDTTISNEAFYVLGKLETSRCSNTCDYAVTVYKEFTIDNKKYLGDSTFIISHKMKKNEINKLIEEALYSAGFIKNLYYEIPSDDRKKSFKEKPFEKDSFEIMKDVSDTMFACTSEDCRFNALEIFYTIKTTHIINSNNIDMKKTLHKMMIEAIPSFDGSNDKVELYKQFHYKNIDLNIIKQDAINSLDDVKLRYNATKLPNIKKCDIIIKNEEVSEFFHTLIDDADYINEYKKCNMFNIGDMIQENPIGDKINISLTKSSKADAFDNDGIILKDISIVEDGKLVNTYGSSRYAYYLNKKPTGIYYFLKSKPGSTKFESMCKKPYIEIMSLSGLQLDMYSSYIGGEVRLAKYFDGNNTYPISGFSFSGNVKQVLSDLTISKETVELQNYFGPKYIKFKDLDVL